MSNPVGRRAGLVVFGLGVAALLAAAVGWAWYARRAAEATELPFMELATDKSLGINADLSQLDPLSRQETMAAMDKAGFRWLRHRFPWDAIEPEPGSYDWTVWDDIVTDAARHSLRLVAVLDGAPAWARAEEDAGNALAPPAETRDFGDFVAAFAARYGDRIDHYQMWDEPNIAPHWGAREIDPAAYARLLREGAIRVRAADPGAIILTAALAPNVEPGGENLSDLLFLDALYQQGGAEWFDAVAAQPYNLEGTTDEPADAARLNWQRPALLRQVMETHNDAGKAIWAVSFGLGGAAPGAVEEAVKQAREDWPWLGPMFWASWSPDDAHGEYALVDGDGRPGLSYKELQALATASSVAWPGVYPANHASGQYEGSWRVTPSGADLGGSGDRLRIPFRGTRLDLAVRRGDYRAFLFVTIDGQPANALPQDANGRAYVVLYDPLHQVDTVTLGRNLPDTEHLAEIVAERGWGQWAIVGWAVSHLPSGSLSWPSVGLGLLVVGALCLTGYMTWTHHVSLAALASTFVQRCRSLDFAVWLVLTAGVAVLLYVMVGTVASLAVVAVLAILLCLRPQVGLPLIALALPFYQPGKPLLGKVFSMVEILTLLTALGWFLNWIPWAWRSRREALNRTKTAVMQLTALDWGVLALLAVGASSLLWAEHLRVAAREFRTVVLEASVYYGLLRVMIPRRQEPAQGERILWYVVDAWVLGAFLIALVGLYQWVFGQNLITAEGVWRVRGFYGSPNNLALYLGRVLPLAVALAIWGRRGRPMRVAYSLAALLMAAAIFLTYSRGAWILGVPASLLFLAAMRGRRSLIVAVSLIVVLAVAVLLISDTARLTSLLNTTEGTTSFRLQLWQSSWAMIRDHPLLGVGLDNFLYAYRTRYVLPTAWEEFNLSHPHNVVLDFWLRLGVPGLMLMLWLLVQFFRRGWGAYRNLPESNGRLLALGLLAGMVNFVAHGLVDNAFFLVDLAFVFMLMLALIQVVAGGEWVTKSERSMTI